MIGRFIIKGGKPLKGDISVWGSKNSATKLIAACLLTSETCYIENVPKIADVLTMIKILEELGAEIKWTSERSLEITAKNIEPLKLNKELVGHLRSSIVLLGPLFARFGEVKSTYPGGDKIGARPITTHLNVFRALGAEIYEESDGILIKKSQKSENNKRIQKK